MMLPRALYNYSHYITYYFKVFFLCLICFGIYYGFFRSTTDYSKHPHFIYLQELRENQKNAECVIPEVDPWDPSILSYYSKPSPLVCSSLQSQAVKSFKNGVLTFDLEVIQNADCYKVEISHDENVTDLDVKYGSPILLDLSKSASIEISEEMFQISCESRNLLKTEIFKYHYAQIVSKKTNIRNKTIEKSTEEFPSVIMIGLDSMSRGNFVRQMPKTYKYMQDLGFIDMKGHMKIHDNTYGNLLAILTGKRGEFKAEMNESWHIAFDDFEFVWKSFSEKGYVTLFAEDRPDIGTFTYKNLLRGFLQQPTDHYLRPYWISAFWSLISRRSAASCYDNKPQHKMQLEYLETFLEKYENKRKFAFWWSQDMSHGFLNLIGRIDDDFEEFLKTNKKRMEDSIVIIFSDHGHRYDKIRETVIGRIESRMPFHSIRIPDGVKKKYPQIVENLKLNSKIMTTQFDVNDSLRKISSGKIGESWSQTDRKRSYSYFDPFPKRTGCFEAGIPSDFCPCFSEIEIPKNEAKEAAGELMRIVNDLLENTEQTEEYEMDSKELKEYMCTPMEIDNIEYSSVRLPMLSVVKDAKSEDTPLQSFSLQYHVVVRAKPPSYALLESTLEHNLKTDVWSSLGEIERNNKWKDSTSPACTSNKLFAHEASSLYRIFHSCTYPRWANNRGKTERFLRNLPQITSSCGENEVIKNIELSSFSTEKKVYWALPPKCQNENVLVVLGIQNDSESIKEMRKVFQNLTTFGTNAYGVSNKDIDYFYNFAIGVNDTGIQTIYDINEEIIELKELSVQSFFENVLKQKRIDMLWINSEGGEFAYWSYFSKRSGQFDTLGIKVCQFILEINLEDTLHFEKFLINLYQSRTFVFLRAQLSKYDNLIYVYFLNVRDSYCVRKYLNE
ncbi:unnamed protein product [Caenorhabditis brenneri]